MQVGRNIIRAAAAVLALSLLAACKTDGDPFVNGSILRPATQGTFAIESIDGLPEPVFHRLVAQLSTEAEARKLPVVSRLATPAYRVRLYLAAETEGRRGRIGWVAEIFDGAEQRVARLSGAEPAGAARRDLWQKVDDALLARIAAQSLEAIMTALGAAPVPPAPREGPSAPAGTAIAYAEPAR
jgi:hypothetical protein